MSKEERIGDVSAQLDIAMDNASKVISAVSDAFSGEWKKAPSTGVRAVFGRWANTAVRHLQAVAILAREGDLTAVSEIHHRQLVEILIQVRYLASVDGDVREQYAQKVAAWGCVDYLRKMEKFKDEGFAQAGYTEMEEILEKFDPDIVRQVGDEMDAGKWYWYGMSPSALAKQVSREGEDLKSLYHIVSAQLHGSWDVTLGVSSPAPGILDFREYPDEETRISWAAELVDRSTSFLLMIWNAIAEAVGADQLVTQADAGESA